MMTNMSVRENDVIAINVSGEIFQTKRSTLTRVFPNTYIANLFSGRWESSIERDPEGRYFLDFCPSSFALILEYMRNKTYETPDRPAAVPVVPPERQDAFEKLLHFMNLTQHIPFRAGNAESTLNIAKFEARHGRRQYAGGMDGGGASSQFPMVTNGPSTILYTLIISMVSN